MEAENTVSLNEGSIHDAEITENMQEEIDFDNSTEVEEEVEFDLPEESFDNEEEGITDEDSDFDFEDVIDEEDDTETIEGEHVFSGYNLDSFKGEIDFKSEGISNFIEERSKEMSDLGFSQEQAEYLIEAQLSMNDKHEPTNEEVKERLNAELSSSEKRDYKVIGNFLKNKLDDSSIDINSVMKDPEKYRLARALYKNNNSSNDEYLNSNAPARRDMIDHRGAKSIYAERLRGGESPRVVLKDMISKAASPDKMRQTFSGFLHLL